MEQALPRRWLPAIAWALLLHAGVLAVMLFLLPAHKVLSPTVVAEPPPHFYTIALDPSTQPAAPIVSSTSASSASSAPSAQSAASAPPPQTARTAAAGAETPSTAVLLSQQSIQPTVATPEANQTPPPASQPLSSTIANPTHTAPPSTSASASADAAQRSASATTTAAGSSLASEYKPSSNPVIPLPNAANSPSSQPKSTPPLVSTSTAAHTTASTSVAASAPVSTPKHDTTTSNAAQTQPTAAHPASTDKSHAARPPVHSPATYSAAYLNNPKPRYPELSKLRGESGITLLRVSISADGKAYAVQVQQSSGSRSLDDAAVKAVLAWRFVPSTVDASPVSSTVLIPITFILE
jgi:periplasmic protein TonB